MNELELNQIELAADEHEVVATIAEIQQEDNTDLEVSSVKNEYSIVGDALYASVSAGNAPQWLVNIIDSVVDGLISGKVTDLQTAVASINQSLLELDIAKNQYQELINIEETIDGVITSKLETLNATVAGNAANILSLDTNKVTADEALAIAIDHLNAQISDGDIYSLVTALNTAIANAEISASSQINTLTSVFDNNQSTVESILSSSAGEYSAEANAVTDLMSTSVDENGDVSYGGIVGKMVTKTAEGVASVGASTSSQAYLNNVYAQGLQSNFTNILGDYVNSGLEYKSIISINGKQYESGFGLNITGNGSGTVADPYESEFWINAERLKFTNSNQTGQAAPFTIDASGTVPQVKFNGVVEFSNINGGDDIALNSELAAGTTVIDGAGITTGTVTADKINTTDLEVQNVGPGGNTPSFEIRADGTAGEHVLGVGNGVNIYGSSIYGGDISGSAITGGTITGTTGSFKGELTLSKLGNSDVTISDGSSYIPAIAFDTVTSNLSVSGGGGGTTSSIYVSKPIRNHTSFLFLGNLNVVAYDTSEAGDTTAIGFVHYSVDNGASWVLIGASGAGLLSEGLVHKAVSGVMVPSTGTNLKIRVTLTVDGEAGTLALNNGSLMISNLG